MRIVCDTSVAISGVLWGGIPNKILKLAEEGLIELCGTTKTIAACFKLHNELGPGKEVKDGTGTETN